MSYLTGITAPLSNGKERVIARREKEGEISGELRCWFF